VSPILRDLLDKIFVLDPENRISLSSIKEHRLFQDFDFTVTMRDRFENSVAPFIPIEPTFEECAIRTSETMNAAKPKNILAAIMGNPTGAVEEVKEKRLSFDSAHYNKFEREDNREHSPTKRKRQNPLGDFKFMKINEIF